MLIADSGVKGGRRVVVVGLSAENVRRVVAGDPVFAKLDGGLEIVVWAGSTEAEMSTQLQDLVTADTELRIDPKVFGGHD